MKTEQARKEAYIVLGDMFRAARNGTTYAADVVLSADRLEETWKRYYAERYANTRSGEQVKRIFEPHCPPSALTGQIELIA
jgi:hypothetical protein